MWDLLKLSVIGRRIKCRFIVIALANRGFAQSNFTFLSLQERIAIRGNLRHPHSSLFNRSEVSKKNKSARSANHC